jgi:DNA-binding XRE family transcriptional regulator
MRERHERLREARERLYETAADAARAMSLIEATYYGHENGSRGPDPDEWRQYARKFKVNILWLLYEDGPRDRVPSYTDNAEDLPLDDQELVRDFIETLKNRRLRQSA